MADIENKFFVLIRLPFNRGDFIDPPPVAWSAAKERALWDVISRRDQTAIEWHTLADEFEVTQPFLLQQAAWLYERQLSQVRAQMRKVGSRQSVTPSPAPGSMTASMMGGQAMKRGGSGGSRVPSRLSTQAMGSPMVGAEGSAPGTPAKSRTSLPQRAASNVLTSQVRGPSGSSRPLSRQSSKDTEVASHGYARQSSTQNQTPRSPAQRTQSTASDSEGEAAQSKITARRANPSSIHRRALSLRKDQPSPRPPQPHPPEEDDDDDDSPSFLPFAANSSETTSTRHSSSQHDSSATLRGGFVQSQSQAHQTPQRPSTQRRSTSERITSPAAPLDTTPTHKHQQQQQELMTSSTSSVSSNPMRAATQLRPATNTLSPRQQASLASATGTRLSPRRTANNGGSDTSPSMGSSFSDLDDASVTQSALEEALMSGMGNTTSTIGGAGGAVASRVSGISQALRSRYLDARGTPQGGPGAGGGSGGAGAGRGETDR